MSETAIVPIEQVRFTINGTGDAWPVTLTMHLSSKQACQFISQLDDSVIVVEIQNEVEE